MKKMFLPMVISIMLLVACNNEKKTDETGNQTVTGGSTESKEEKNKETALASVNAFIAGDIDKTLKDVTADAVDYG